MKKSLFIVFSLLFLLCFTIRSVSAQSIVVVKSADIKPYNDALKGFKTVINSDFEEISLSEEDTPYRTLDAVRNIKPDLIFAIGLNALLHVESIHDVPVVFAMVSNPQNILVDKKNITGVSMNVSAQRQLDELLNILPYAETVGIVYDSQKTGHLFNEARDSVTQKGLSVVSRVISNPRDAPTAIKDIMGSIDVFWLLPDTTVIKKETLEYLFLASIEQKVPVITFSDIYLDMGALLALSIDAEDIGRQAGELSRRVLEGKDAIENSVENPREVNVKINHKIAEKLGIAVDNRINLKQEHRIIAR